MQQKMQEAMGGGMPPGAAGKMDPQIENELITYFAGLIRNYTTSKISKGRKQNKSIKYIADYKVKIQHVLESL